MKYLDDSPDEVFVLVRELVPALAAPPVHHVPRLTRLHLSTSFHVYLPWSQCSFSIVSQCLKCKNGSSRFQPGEGPSRGLLRGYGPLDGPSFQALKQIYLVTLSEHSHSTVILRQNRHLPQPCTLCVVLWCSISGLALPLQSARARTRRIHQNLR